jgi:hypothetical protein
VIVDGTWSWNWNFNCTSPNAPSGSGQYQNASTQYQPQNSNISIRIGSPGDNGPVTQTIAAVAQATTATVNAIAQTVSQITESVGAAPATSSTFANTAATVAQEVVTAVSAAVAAVLPAAVTPPPVVTALPMPPMPPMPPISALGGLDLPSVVPLPPELGKLVGLGLLPPTPNVGQGLETRSRPAPARLPQPAYGAGAASAWDGPLAPVAGAAQRASTGTPPARAPQRPGPRHPMPAPGGSSVAGAGGSSAAGVAAAALAAMLASYFFVPPFGAWRVRSPRDRRRLRPRASRLERPG